MPTYEYRCPTCDERFELFRPMADSAKPATCPSGHRGAKRVLSAFARTGVGAGASGGSPTAGVPCGGHCTCHPG